MTEPIEPDMKLSETKPSDKEQKLGTQLDAVKLLVRRIEENRGVATQLLNISHAVMGDLTDKSIDEATAVELDAVAQLAAQLERASGRLARRWGWR